MKNLTNEAVITEENEEARDVLQDSSARMVYNYLSLRETWSHSLHLAKDKTIIHPIHCLLYTSDAADE